MEYERLSLIMIKYINLPINLLQTERSTSNSSSSTESFRFLVESSFVGVAPMVPKFVYTSKAYLTLTNMYFLSDWPLQSQENT